MVKLSWWKWIFILLMPYVILMGFLVPLGQGITDISPFIVYPLKTNKLDIIGYNTRFGEDQTLRAWLKQGDYHLEADKIEVLGNRHASLYFYIPGFPGSGTNGDLSLVMDTPEGPLVLPSAVNLSPSKEPSSDTSQISNSWSTTKLMVREESNFNFPFRNILNETIRNTYFHVPLWFAMVLLFFLSVLKSIRYLQKKQVADDAKAESYVLIGVLFGILGTVTGSIWAKYTWGSFWSFDVKQNMAAISLLIYGGYFIIRNSVQDPDAKARVSGIYNVFAFMLMIPLIFIIPRRYDSLHPGNGGNPALGSQDLDNTMRLVFYPAVLAYMIGGIWIAQIRYRIKMIYNTLY